jgi:hypothetical protein
MGSYGGLYFATSSLTEKPLLLGQPAVPGSAVSMQYCQLVISYLCHRLCLCLLMHFSINPSVLYNMAWVQYTIEQHVCLVQLYFKYESGRKCRRKFQHKFPGEPVPGRQNIHYLVNKLKTKVSLLNKKPDRKWTVLTEEILDNTGARLQTSARKSLKLLAQETEVSITSARRATKLLKLVVHSLN